MSRACAIICGVKITSAVDSLLHEAARRLVTFGDRDSKWYDLRTQWIGLGTATTYKAAVSSGLMKWPDGSRYSRRCVGWYVFTDLGVAVFAAWLALQTVEPVSGAINRRVTKA